MFILYVGLTSHCMRILNNLTHWLGLALYAEFSFVLYTRFTGCESHTLCKPHLTDYDKHCNLIDHFFLQQNLCKAAGWPIV